MQRLSVCQLNFRLIGGRCDTQQVTVVVCSFGETLGMRQGVGTTLLLAKSQWRDSRRRRQFLQLLFGNGGFEAERQSGIKMFQDGISFYQISRRLIGAT